MEIKRNKATRDLLDEIVLKRGHDKYGYFHWVMSEKLIAQYFHFVYVPKENDWFKTLDNITREQVKGLWLKKLREKGLSKINKIANKK